MSIWCTVSTPDPILDIEEYLERDGTHYEPGGEVYVDTTTMHPDCAAAVRIISDYGHEITVSREHAGWLRDALTVALESLDRKIAMERRRAAEWAAERAERPA